ncbi:hypothetical protein PS623_03282 [Pseudomonas fluorescens]|nr:hypothetical protein PS623_03282 [Pseudomonas fluorescens]
MPLNPAAIVCVACSILPTSARRGNSASPARAPAAIRWARPMTRCNGPTIARVINQAASMPTSSASAVAMAIATPLRLSSLCMACSWLAYAWSTALVA